MRPSALPGLLLCAGAEVREVWDFRGTNNQTALQVMQQSNRAPT